MNFNRRFFCVGETVYDIIFKNGKPVDGTPGGAVLNSAVSLGRLGLDVYLVGDYANDAIGKIIENFLLKNNVSARYVTRYDNALSRLAIAFLNDRNDADYSFYKIRKNEKAYLNFPEPESNDIILFGSFYGIKEEIRPCLVPFLEDCILKKAFVLYDPNFRKNHLAIKKDVMPYIEENIAMSSVVKGSDEDFLNLFNTSDPDEVYDIVRKLGNKILVMTANKSGVYIRTPKVKKHYCAGNISPLSTVGAGDSFNAGFIYALHNRGINTMSIADLDEADWNYVVKTAMGFAESVCMSFDNYISIDFASKLKYI